MDFYYFTGIEIDKMSVITRPVCLSLQSWNMVHCEGDIILTAVIRNNLIETAQLIRFPSFGCCFRTVFRPKFVPLKSLPLLFQDLFGIRLQIIQIQLDFSLLHQAMKKIKNMASYSINVIYLARILK